MSIKGSTYLQKELVQIHTKGLSNKHRLVSYYPFATDILNENQNQEDTFIEVWKCRHCGKEYSDNCDCKSEFEKHIIKY